MTPDEMRSQLGVPLDDASDDLLLMLQAVWESWQRGKGKTAQTYHHVGDCAYFFAGYLQGDLDRRRYLGGGR